MGKRAFEKRQCPDCGGQMIGHQPPFLCENCEEWKSKGKYANGKNGRLTIQEEDIHTIPDETFDHRMKS
ncbi:MAG: hypothetical protein ACTSPB_00515 [Candidatus Thorarchaeota archaeon]